MHILIQLALNTSTVSLDSVTMQVSPRVSPTTTSSGGGFIDKLAREVNNHCSQVVSEEQQFRWM